MENKEFEKSLEIEFLREEAEFKDLRQDFEFVVDLNRTMADRYQEVFDCFPTVHEINFIIQRLEESQKEDKDIRLVKLKKFRSALEAIEKNDPQIKPRRYEDLKE